MKNAQGVAKVEKRREDARALRKLSRKEKTLSLISHAVLFTCEDLRSWSAMRPRIAFGRLNIVVFLSDAHRAFRLSPSQGERIEMTGSWPTEPFAYSNPHPHPPLPY